ncbi:nucleosome-remodeling factor subunit BPTF-like [Anneissia japonica]|uniref:nucleosome-remodeling factor subunit BPTF-like n=1 Tax=Anneissia japonica TaxID=1529436 RepID=UPI00142563C5|nr:nucleosome-remodeling factor subunit BPTF-like [Anneissia japonica]
MKRGRGRGSKLSIGSRDATPVSKRSKTQASSASASPGSSRSSTPVGASSVASQRADRRESRRVAARKTKELIHKVVLDSQPKKKAKTKNTKGKGKSSKGPKSKIVYDDESEDENYEDLETLESDFEESDEVNSNQSDSDAASEAWDESSLSSGGSSPSSGRRKYRHSRNVSPLIWLDSQEVKPLELPETSDDLILPRDLILDALSVYEVLRHFFQQLRLSPFRFEDFCAALASEEQCVLLAETHMALLKNLMKEEEANGTTFGPQDVKDSINVQFNFLDAMTWPELVRSYIECDVEFLPILTSFTDQYPFHPPKDKIKVLKFLTDQFLATNKVREEIISEGAITYDDHCRSCHRLGDLICCETCSAVYHLQCVDPNMTEVPDEDWLCEVCLAHKVPGVYDCLSDIEKSGMLIRQEPLGFDRLGRKYFFLCRRIFVESETDCWYYSSKVQIDALMRCLDPYEYEANLCSVLTDCMPEILEHVQITEELTNKARGSAKSYLDDSNAKILVALEEQKRAEEEKRQQEQEEKLKKAEEKEKCLKKETDHLTDNTDDQVSKEPEPSSEKPEDDTQGSTITKEQPPGQPDLVTKHPEMTGDKQGQVSKDSNLIAVEEMETQEIFSTTTTTTTTTTTVETKESMSSSQELQQTSEEVVMSETTTQTSNITTSSTTTVSTDGIEVKDIESSPQLTENISEESQEKNNEVTDLQEGNSGETKGYNKDSDSLNESGLKKRTIVVMNIDGSQSTYTIEENAEDSKSNDVTAKKNSIMTRSRNPNYKPPPPKSTPFVTYSTNIPKITKSAPTNQKTNKEDSSVLVINSKGEIKKVENKKDNNTKSSNGPVTRSADKLFKLGLEGTYKLYKNQFTCNRLALNKPQHAEDRDKRRYLSYKFSLSANNKFDWMGSVFGQRNILVTTHRMTLTSLERNIPKCFMHHNWQTHRNNWVKAVNLCSKPKEFCLALSILECAVKPVFFNLVWNEGLGHSRMRRMTVMEREEGKKHEKKRKDEEEDSQKLGYWVKYSFPVKHQIWKQKGEEYRAVGGKGWHWISSTKRCRPLPNPSPALQCLRKSIERAKANGTFDLPDYREKTLEIRDLSKVIEAKKQKIASEVQASSEEETEEMETEENSEVESKIPENELTVENQNTQIDNEPVVKNIESGENDISELPTKLIIEKNKIQSEAIKETLPDATDIKVELKEPAVDYDIKTEKIDAPRKANKKSKSENKFAALRFNELDICRAMREHVVYRKISWRSKLEGLLEHREKQHAIDNEAYESDLRKYTIYKRALAERTRLENLLREGEAAMENDDFESVIRNAEETVQLSSEKEILKKPASTGELQAEFKTLPLGKSAESVVKLSPHKTLANTDIKAEFKTMPPLALISQKTSPSLANAKSILIGKSNSSACEQIAIKPATSAPTFQAAYVNCLQNTSQSLKEVACLSGKEKLASSIGVKTSEKQLNISQLGSDSLEKESQSIDTEDSVTSKSDAMHNCAIGFEKPATNQLSDTEELTPQLTPSEDVKKSDSAKLAAEKSPSGAEDKPLQDLVTEAMETSDCVESSAENMQYHNLGTEAIDATGLVESSTQDNTVVSEELSHQLTPSEEDVEKKSPMVASVHEVLPEDKIQQNITRQATTLEVESTAKDMLAQDLVTDEMELTGLVESIENDKPHQDLVTEAMEASDLVGSSAEDRPHQDQVTDAMETSDCVERSADNMQYHDLGTETQEAFVQVNSSTNCNTLVSEELANWLTPSNDVEKSEGANPIENSPIVGPVHLSEVLPEDTIQQKVTRQASTVEVESTAKDMTAQNLVTDEMKLTELAESIGNNEPLQDLVTVAMETSGLVDSSAENLPCQDLGTEALETTDLIESSAKNIPSQDSLKEAMETDTFQNSVSLPSLDNGPVDHEIEIPYPENVLVTNEKTTLLSTFAGEDLEKRTKNLDIEETATLVKDECMIPVNDKCENSDLTSDLKKQNDKLTHLSEDTTSENLDEQCVFNNTVVNSHLEEHLQLEPDVGTKSITEKSEKHRQAIESDAAAVTGNKITLNCVEENFYQNLKQAPGQNSVVLTTENDIPAPHSIGTAGEPSTLVADAAKISTITGETKEIALPNPVTPSITSGHEYPVTEIPALNTSNREAISYDSTTPNPAKELTESITPVGSSNLSGHSPQPSVSNTSIIVSPSSNSTDPIGFSINASNALSALSAVAAKEFKAANLTETSVKDNCMKDSITKQTVAESLSNSIVTVSTSSVTIKTTTTTTLSTKITTVTTTTEEKNVLTETSSQSISVKKKYSQETLKSLAKKLSETLIVPVSPPIEYHTYQTTSLTKYSKTKKAVKKVTNPLPICRKFSTKSNRKSVLVLPPHILKKLARHAGRFDVEGFIYNTKAVRQYHWPYPCPRPSFKTCWRYRVQTLNSLASVGLSLRVLWASLRWEDLGRTGSHHETTETENIKTDILKKREVGHNGERTEYLIRKTYTPIVEDLPKEYHKPQRSGLRSSSAPAKTLDDEKPKGPLVTEHWIPEESLELWEIQEFSDRVEKEHQAQLQAKQQEILKEKQKAKQHQDAQINKTAQAIKEQLEQQLKTQKQAMQQKRLQSNTQPGKVQFANTLALPMADQTGLPKVAVNAAASKILSKKNVPTSQQKVVSVTSGLPVHGLRTITPRLPRTPGVKIQTVNPAPLQRITFRPQAQVAQTMQQPVTQTLGQIKLTLPGQSGATTPTIIRAQVPVPLTAAQAQSTGQTQVMGQAQIFASQAQVLQVGGQKFIVTPAVVTVPTTLQTIPAQLIQTQTAQGTTVQRLVLTPNATGATTSTASSSTTTTTTTTPPQVPQINLNTTLTALQQAVPASSSQQTQQQQKQQIIQNQQQIQQQQNLLQVFRQKQMEQMQQIASMQSQDKPQQSTTLFDPKRSLVKIGKERSKTLTAQEKADHARELVCKSLIKGMLDKIEKTEKMDLKRKRQDEFREEKREEKRIRLMAHKLSSILYKHKDQLKNEMRRKRYLLEQKLLHDVQEEAKQEVRREKEMARKRKQQQQQKQQLQQQQQQQQVQQQLQEQQLFDAVDQPIPVALHKAQPVEIKYTPEVPVENVVEKPKDTSRSPTTPKRRRTDSTKSEPKQEKANKSTAAKAQKTQEKEVKKKSNDKLYCICKTPYDASKFYIGCDVCLNWFHGECINISPDEAQNIKDFICNDCQLQKQEQDDELYCLCRTPYDDSQFYIGCDLCNDWFHGQCVGIGQEEAEAIDSYVCKKCQSKQSQKALDKNLTHRDMDHLRKIVRQMQSHKMAWPFLEPVSRDEVPDYYEIIKEPMVYLGMTVSLGDHKNMCWRAYDLSTVETKLKKKKYQKLSEFSYDVGKVFDNCRLYNPSDSPFYQCADILEKFFVHKMKSFKH